MSSEVLIELGVASAKTKGGLAEDEYELIYCDNRAKLPDMGADCQ